MAFSIRKCTIDDAKQLNQFARMTFMETFGSQNSIDDMTDYVKQAFDLEQMSLELENDKIHFYQSEDQAGIVGYLKLNEYPYQTDHNEPDSLEVERIYVARGQHGGGIGKQLMAKAEAVGRDLKSAYLWLGVWEQNEKAIQFYQKYGFEVFGHHSFMLGNDEQHDLLMKKLL